MRWKICRCNVRWSAGAAYYPINSHLWNQYFMGGRSANTWSAKCWALRVGMKYELSEQQSVKLPYDGGLICQHLVCQIWALRVEQESVKLPSDVGGYIWQDLVCQMLSSQSRNEIKVARVGISEIATQMGVDLPRPGLPNVELSE